MLRRETRGSPGLAIAIRSGRRTARDCSRSAASMKSTSSSSDRKRPSWQAWPTSFATLASPCSGRALPPLKSKARSSSPRRSWLPPACRPRSVFWPLDRPEAPAPGPRVLGFNCRFGDPETESIMPRLEGDLLELLHAAATGRLSGGVQTGDESAVTVVLAAPDYPERNDAGSPIDGVADAEATGALVFHAGSAMRGDRLVTNGGRILNMTGVGED